MNIVAQEVIAHQRAQAKKKKQLIAVAALAVVLLAVLLWPAETEQRNLAVPQLAVTSVSNRSASPNASTSTSEVGAAIQSEDADAESAFDHVVALASLETDELFAVNLFRGSDVPPTEPASPDVPETTPTNRQSYSVGAVYGSFDSTDRSALIDDTIVRSGDLLNGDDHVIAISSEGVTLADEGR